MAGRGDHRREVVGWWLVGGGRWWWVVGWREGKEQISIEGQICVSQKLPIPR